MVDRRRPARRQVGHRKLAGVPKAEVVGLSKEKVTEIFGEHDYPVQGRSGRSPQEITSAFSGIRWKETGMATRHCRPYAS